MKIKNKKIINNIILVLNIIFVHVIASDLSNVYLNPINYKRVYGNDLTSYKLSGRIILLLLCVQLIFNLFLYLKKKKLTSYYHILSKVNIITFPLLIFGIIISSYILF